jgi:hypothetical protein
VSAELGEVSALGQQGVQGACPTDYCHGAVLGVGGAQHRGEVLANRVQVILGQVGAGEDESGGGKIQSLGGI